jgi:hypothetical protein
VGERRKLYRIVTGETGRNDLVDIGMNGSAVL